MNRPPLTEQILKHLDQEVAGGKSVRSIAGEIGISQTALRCIHRREKRPQSDTLDRLAERYKLHATRRR